MGDVVRVFGVAVAISCAVVTSACTTPGPPTPTTTTGPSTSTSTTTQPSTSTTQAPTTVPPPTTTTTTAPPTTTTTRPSPTETPGLTHPERLTPYTGPGTITGGTVVIEDKEIPGRLVVEGGHVTIRNSRFRFEDYYQLIAEGGTVVVEHSEFDGANRQANLMGAMGPNLTVRWSRFTGFENGMRLDSNSTAEHNLVAEPNTSIADAHSDGIEVGSGSNIVIRSNAIDIVGGSGATGCINIGTAFGDISNVLVEDNDLRGGTYSLYVRAEGGHTVGDVRVRNNRWHSGADYGTHSVDPLAAVVEWVGNTLDGTPIDLG